jgi:hypothetical protein
MKKGKIFESRALRDNIEEQVVHPSCINQFRAVHCGEQSAYHCIDSSFS